MRIYTERDRELANQARFANILERPVQPRPADRVPGYIIHFVNGIYTVVNLEPEGYCCQHRAILPNGDSILSGMDGIHAKIREIMPPLMSWRSF